MKLTVVDIEGDELFVRNDFATIGNFDEIEILQLPSVEPLDGSIFRSLPDDTTHVVMRLADRLGPPEINFLKSLEYVGLAYTGWWDKYFDYSALREKNITVTNNPEYAPNAVAEAIFTIILGSFRKIEALRLGDPDQRSPTGRELRERIMGIIGLGHMGRAVASMAYGFGMRVMSDSKNCPAQFSCVTRRELVETSDVLGAFVPKSAGVVIGSSDFASMRPDVFLVNPSGHENIDTEALAGFLIANPGAIYAYLAMPEPEYFRRLSSLPNAKLFPLFASNTTEARHRRKIGAINNLREYVAGQRPKNRVI